MVLSKSEAVWLYHTLPSVEVECHTFEELALSPDKLCVLDMERIALVDGSLLKESKRELG